MSIMRSGTQVYAVKWGREVKLFWLHRDAQTFADDLATDEVVRLQLCTIE